MVNKSKQKKRNFKSYVKNNKEQNTLIEKNSKICEDKKTKEVQERHTAFQEM